MHLLIKLLLIMMLRACGTYFGHILSKIFGYFALPLGCSLLQIKFASNKTTENVPENWHQKEGGFFCVTTNKVDD